MFVKTRSLDEIVERAHRMILEAVSARLAPVAP
jgi:stearoyl-CoA desaturase (delta-9 desaturase)